MGFTFPGFAAILRAWLGALGFSAGAAQALPFAFGVAAPPVLFVLGLRRGLRPGASLAAAALLLASPVHLEYSSRVKSYTLDALLAVGLLAAAWWVIEAPADRRRWVVAVAAAVASTVLSAAVVPVVAGLFAAGLVVSPRRAAAAGAVYGAFGALWWALVLRRSVNPGLRAFWEDFYVDGPGDVAEGLWRVLDGFAPLPVPVTASLLVAAGAGLAVRRRPLLALVAAPVAVAVAAAALEVAPLGGGRTDTFLFPVLALAVGGGLEPLVPRGVSGWALGAASVGVLAALAPAAGPYPAEDVAPLVALAEGERRAPDAVLVYPATRWAYALYTDSPVAFARERDDAPGYRVAIAHGAAHVHVLPAAGRADPDAYVAAARQVVAGHDRVWVVASHWRDDLADLRAALASAGMAESRRWERPGALLMLWTRAR